MAQNEEQSRAEAAESAGRLYTNFWEIALRRISLVALGLVVGLVLGTLHYAMRTPLYRSDAQLLVIKKQPDAAPLTGVDQRPVYYEDYLATHQVIIKSPVIIGRAVKKRDLKELKSFAGLADPTNSISRALVVNRELKESAGSSNILNLSFRGRVAEECPLVLAAVIDSYKDFLDETYKNVNDDTVELITKARDVLKNELAQKDQAYQQFRHNSPLLGTGKGGTSIDQEKLGSIESRRSGLLVRRAELQGRLAAIDKALKAGRSRAAVLALVSTSATSDAGKRPPPTLDLQTHLVPLLEQEQQLMEDYGANYPQLHSVRKRIELIRKLSAETTEPLTGSEKGTQGLFRDGLDFYVESLKQELEDIQMSEQILAERFQNQYTEARKLTNYEVQDEVLRGDMARTHQLYDGIIKRLQEINLIRDFGGYDARTIAPAGPGWQIEPNAWPIFSSAILLGLLGGFGLAYVADRTDRSFRTPLEVRRRLGLPIVGHIPLIEPVAAGNGASSAHAGADPLLWAHYRPRSQEAESYRGVRTALYFSTHGKGHSIVQITSPDMGDGKTTLVANLGVSIAQSGKKVLLVDADFRRPRLHKIFGLSATVGLATVIQGEAELDAVIQESVVPGLSVLPCGAIPPNPAELLTPPRFKEILELVRGGYDYVLVDTPPLLAVTDPCVVAPCVDGVLLNLRISKNGRPNAERAREILTTLGVTVFGIVVNGVRRHPGAGGYGYGYENYQYGQGYLYTNGYRSDDGEQGYYHDGDVSAAPGEAADQMVAGNGEDNGSPGHRSSQKNQGRKGRASKGRSSSSRPSFLRRLLRLG